MAADRSTDLQGQLLEAEPMSRHTTWHVGGPADRFYRPAGRDDLARFLAMLPESEPLYWCGLGSNLLVRDGGLRGTVIFLQPGLTELRTLAGNRLWVDAGVACAKAARFAARNGLVGAEFLAGIPGTMGGALAMNAGAFGGETWQVVDWVETVDRGGRIRRRPVEDYAVAYREVTRPTEEWFLGAMLQLQPGDGDAAMSRIRELLSTRAATQPIGKPSCGSVFRNPEGDHAARLIESAGLKGHRIGGAVVSEKHANFILNAGGATAEDIEQLIAHVQAVVERTHGVRLHPEVHMIGEARS
ncbi:UDP-N-acetylmuramate dehydrogenase [Natronocella acetinitrilica]|uniref:UDP-N-acetylenolpyruvoylglucosamine reductase n=1 Tax=Natronocella acetinitrilica TaxID=414046 RepID=A0AAE3G2C6_9GAMM|nr:UDP-N-acetylmuramate dehydrogenase [Natronocella acetinitrilica]MCP1673853.1 UDP-N-acetylmuramate dehydrogenase [Natronocella acetinitrilica]